MTGTPAVRLSDGHSIPQLGFGVWRLPDEDAARHVRAALDAGYRHVDTAQGYGNEAGVGQGLRDAGLPRGEVFVTSKLRTADQGRDRTMRSFDGTMQRLGLEVLDLFLIHWPLPKLDRYVETWKALIELRAQGRVRSIGVSNFLPTHVARLVFETGEAPAINQVELHPFWQQRDIRAIHAARGIPLACYSPLGGDGAPVLADPAVTAIAAARGCTPAQVVLAWHLAQGLVPLPKSAHPGRIAENLGSLPVTLSAGEIAALDALDRPDGKVLPQPWEMETRF